LESVDLEALSRDEHPIMQAARALETESAPPRLSAALAKQAKAQRERGYVFHLRAMNATALVRKLSLGDQAVLGALPQFIQTKLLQGLADVAQTKSALRTNGALDTHQALSNIARREDLINATCVAGFIDPPLILSEAHRTSDDQILVTDLDYDDRLRFFNACNGDADEVKALEPFLGPARDAAEPVAAG
jgi:hypothetical protein